MRLLLDSNLSHRVADLLRAHDVDATHVRDHGLQHEPDERIFDFAAAGGYVLVSEDTDFGEILATRRAPAVARPVPVRPAAGPRGAGGAARGEPRVGG